MSLLDSYAPIVGATTLRMIRRLASGLEGIRLLTINSTRTGGGVAEILQRLVPLLRELGIDAEWEVIEGTSQFFRFTKNLHNALQGLEEEPTPEDFEEYKAVLQINSERLNFERDVILIHDPQPVGLIAYTRKLCPWVWRCHIDLSRPQRAGWRFLEPYVEQYDASVFTLPSFARTLSHPQYIIEPTIDPLSEKNRELSEVEIDRVYNELRIPRDMPVLLQVSRFDRFKDPIGVIDAFQLVRRYTPCRLVLAGGTATDDPEGEAVYRQVKERAQGEQFIHIRELPPNADFQVNALQRGADIIIQKSLREGFGLTVTEALWKGKPVIAGAVGGILVQVYDGFDGYVVHSTEGAAYWIRFLLSRPDLRQRMGENGRKLVRRNFLITRQLLDYPMLLRAVTGRAKPNFS